MKTGDMLVAPEGAPHACEIPAVDVCWFSRFLPQLPESQRIHREPKAIIGER